MRKRNCPRCVRAADVGVYCYHCAKEIMGKALSPQFGGRAKRALRTVPTTPPVPLCLID